MKNLKSNGNYLFGCIEPIDDEFQIPLCFKRGTNAQFGRLGQKRKTVHVLAMTGRGLEVFDVQKSEEHCVFVSVSGPRMHPKSVDFRGSWSSN